jgi:hypothetical protein
MESEDSELPRANVADPALARIADDRRALVREVTRTNAWHHLAVALLAAIMVWAPAIGSVGQLSVVMALGTFVAMSVLAWLYDASFITQRQAS